MGNKLYHEVDGKKFYLGCNRDPAHKDAKLLLSREQIETLPASYIIKDGTPVGNQGNLGSCTANAADNASKIRSYTAIGTYFNGSRMQVYQCALAHDGNPMQDVGSSLSTVAYILENIGIAPETEFPYTAQLGTPVPTKVLNDAAKDKTTKATRLDANDQSITLANIKAAIAPNAVLPPCYPVMFGFDVPNSFFNTGSDGNMPTPSGGISGGHANVFIGYDDNHVGNYDGSKGALFAKNSWGTGWGANGLWWMPYSFFDNVSYESGDAWAIITESDFVTSPPASVQFASTPSILQ